MVSARSPWMPATCGARLPLAAPRSWLWTVPTYRTSFASDAALERDGAEVHGLGETALPPVPAAIGNALASLGVGLTELPMTAERVLESVEARDRQAAGAAV